MKDRKLTMFEKLATLSIFVATIVFCIYVVGTHTVDAVVYHKNNAPNTFISIVQNDVCKIIHCVDSSKYVQYDNSTTNISGRLVKQGYDYTRVGALKNSMNYYNIFSGKTFVFYNPDSFTLGRSKVITLVPSLDDYSINDASSMITVNGTLHQRVLYWGVYVDPLCSYATVGVKQNIDLQKVINYLVSSCTLDFSEFKKEIVTEKTDLIYCGNQCQYEKFMKEAKIKSKKLLINSDNYYDIKLFENVGIQEHNVVSRHILLNESLGIRDIVR